jgi:hypothetical protein
MLVRFGPTMLKGQLLGKSFREQLRDFDDYEAYMV